MSGVAVFGLNYPSLLKFDEHRNEERVRTNLRNLSRVIQAPCDTPLRTVLDEVSPAEGRLPFISLHQQMHSQGVVEAYRYGGSCLVTVEGTGQFASSKVNGLDCCEQHHRHGEVEYSHQLGGAALVHPDKSQGLPLFPEAIPYPEGATQNDGESKARQRRLPQRREAFPDGPMIIVEDRLSAKGPHIKLLKELGFSYIIVVKPDAQAALFEEVQNRLWADPVEELEALGKDGGGRGYRFTTAIPLTKSHPEVLVNDLEDGEIRKGKEHNVSWITDIHLTRAKVYFVMRGGRARWKIETETFNTLNNQGYYLEHHYGPGEKPLATVFALFMRLAFWVDHVQEFCCSLFKAARQKFRSRTSLWDKLRGLFTEYFIESWESLWGAIIYKHKGGVLQPDTS